MNDQKADIVTVVREAFLAAFGEINMKTGLKPTHLDLTLQLDNGMRLRAQRTPIAEGGSGNIEIKMEPPLSKGDA